MHTSFTAVLEQSNTYTESFATEPYEAGWAHEARWFVRVLDLAPGTAVTLAPQISPDGLFWCDEGTPPLTVREPGLRSFPLRDFGQWLRLDAALSGDAPSVKLLVYLALKE